MYPKLNSRQTEIKSVDVVEPGVEQRQNNDFTTLTQKIYKRPCRGLLNEIKSLTFNVYDVDVLDVLHNQLVGALEDLQKVCPNDNGSFLEPNHQKQLLKSALLVWITCLCQKARNFGPQVESGEQLRVEDFSLT